jgi:CheY-like chemotaxis protein
VNVASRIESNAIGTLAACMEYLPEVLLIDASLKSSDALRLVAELRRHPRHVQMPIVLFAGQNSLAQREAAIAAGSDEYLLEPVRQRHLLSVVTSRLQRLNAMKQNGVLPKQQAGLMPRAEFIGEFNRQSDFALMFVRVDQLDRLSASYATGAFDGLDAAISALIRPRLKSKELFAYFQDGQYLLGVKAQSDLQLDDLAEKIRRSIEQSRIDLGQGTEKLTASIVYGKPDATRADSDLRRTEALLHQCRHRCIELSARGGNRTQASALAELQDPTKVQSRKDLPKKLLLQPLLCAAGKLQGQYLAQFVWARDGSETNHYQEILAGARAAGAAKDFDKRLLLMALNCRAEELKRGRQIRVLMEIGEESVCDTELFTWLTNQLNALNLSGSGLSLFAPIDVCAKHAKAWAAKRAQGHAMGMRTGVSLEGQQPQAASQLASVSFDFALLPEKPDVHIQASDAMNGASASNDQAAHWAIELRRARERGAVCIVRNVATRVALDQLKSLRVDFALSETLAPASEHADFDFAGFLRA